MEMSHPSFKAVLLTASTAGRKSVSISISCPGGAVLMASIALTKGVGQTSPRKSNVTVSWLLDMQLTIQKGLANVPLLCTLSMKG